MATGQVTNPGHRRDSTTRELMFGRLVSVGLISVLALSPAVAHAGPILDQAMRHANTLQLGVVLTHGSTGAGCPVAAEAGGRDGRQRQGMVGDVPGRPVPAGYHAHRRAREHATACRQTRMLQYSGDDARCYAASYSDAAAGKRKRGAWIGRATAFRTDRRGRWRLRSRNSR